MAEELTKMQKFKSWCKDHSEELTLTGVFGAFVALIVTATVFESKDQNRRIEAYNKWAKDQNNWLNEQQNAGNNVYQTLDGRYLVVPQDAPQETVIR